MPVVLPFLCPYGWYVAGQVLSSVVILGIIIIVPFMAIPSVTTISYLKYQYGCTPVGLLLSLLASHAVPDLMGCLCTHHLWLPVTFLLMSCILGCLCMFLSHLCLYPFYISLHLYLSHGCVLIASLQWIVTVLVFTGFFMLYVLMCNIILCSICNRPTTSVLNTAIRNLWSVITLTSQVKH